ncbi:D-inositol-3-phosphate glycosyltransferase [subsurface metagenome]
MISRIKKFWILFINKFVPDRHILPFFRIAEIIIYPYTNATQSGSLNFALNAEKPIIATRVGGFKEILRDQVNGLLIPPNDAYELANAIKKLIENQDLAEKIASNGNEFYKKTFSWDIILKKMLNALDTQ